MSVSSATGAAGGHVQKSGSREPGGGMLLELVDRILNKGIVIDIWARVSVLSIEAVTVEARAVVASVETYLKYAEDMAAVSLASRPQQGGAVAAPAPQSQVQLQPQPQGLPQAQPQSQPAAPQVTQPQPQPAPQSQPAQQQPQSPQPQSQPMPPQQAQEQQASQQQ